MCGGDFVSAALPDLTAQTIVAIDDGAIIGYLLYTFGYDTDRSARYLYILDLLVDEANRGWGVGRGLMEQARAICREQGGAELFWAVYEHNRAALAFYEHLGARQVRDLIFMTLPV